MREIRTSGSEGGGAELNRLSLPLSDVTKVTCTPLTSLQRHPPRRGFSRDKRAQVTFS